MAARTLPASHRPSLVVIYGLAHFGKSLFWNTSSLIFAFFLTETVGFSPQTMGYFLSASLLFNACMDYIVGRGLGHRVRTAPAAAKAQLLGGLLAAFAFTAFCAAGFVSGRAQLPYAVVTILLFRLGYSFYDVPQNAFMAFVSRNDSQRAALSATRYVAAGGSIVLIALIFAPIVRDVDLVRQASQFLQIAIGLAIASAFFSSLLYWYSCVSETREERAPPLGSRAFRMSAELAGKDGFVLILASIFVLSLTSPFFTKLEAYFTAFVLEHPISAALFMACVAAGKVVAQPLWVLLTGMRSLAAVFRLAALAWGVSAGLFFLMGHLEPWGTMLSAFLFGGASGGVFMALWSLLARSAAINASDTTRRFGLFTFFSKTAQAISILVIGQMLSLFDYQAIGGQPFLMALMSGIPAVGALILGGVSFLIAARLSAKST